VELVARRGSKVVAATSDGNAREELAAGGLLAMGAELAAGGVGMEQGEVGLLGRFAGARAGRRTGSAGHGEAAGDLQGGSAMGKKLSAEKSRRHGARSRGSHDQGERRGCHGKLQVGGRRDWGAMVGGSAAMEGACCREAGGRRGALLLRAGKKGRTPWEERELPARCRRRGAPCCSREEERVVRVGEEEEGSGG
jgi:hypothetical protein